MNSTYLKVRVGSFAQRLWFRTCCISNGLKRTERVVHARTGCATSCLARRTGATLLRVSSSCSICGGYLRALPMRRRYVPSSGRERGALLLLAFLAKQKRHGGGLAPIAKSGTGNQRRSGKHSVYNGSKEVCVECSGCWAGDTVSEAGELLLQLVAAQRGALNGMAIIN